MARDGSQFDHLFANEKFFTIGKLQCRALHNIHVRNGISEEEFVTMRNNRDASLEMPTLILPSVQINMRAGHFPEPEDNGMRYLKIPLNAL